MLYGKVSCNFEKSKAKITTIDGVKLIDKKPGMHRNHKIHFQPEPEFSETRNKNPAGKTFWKLESFHELRTTDTVRG